MKKICCFLIFLLAFNCYIFADGFYGYFTKGTSNEAQETWQSLEWTDNRSNYVKYYEVRIQHFDVEKNIYLDYRTIKTESNETFVVISPKLEPGNYRYRITPYSLLDIRGTDSDWEYFTIYEAFEPVIKRVKNKNTNFSTIYMNEEISGVFRIEGNNLFDIKRSSNVTKYTDYKLVKVDIDSKVILELKPVSVNFIEEGIVELEFDVSAITPGVYYIIATDASGLKSSYSNGSRIAILLQDIVDVSLSGGYEIPFNFFDDTFNSVLNSWWFESLWFECTEFPLHTAHGDYGALISGDLSKLEFEGDDWVFMGIALSLNFDVAYENRLEYMFGKAMGDFTRSIPNVTDAKFYSYAGFTLFNLPVLQFIYDENYKSDVFSSVYPGLNCGVGIRVYLLNDSFFIDNAYDLRVAFASDSVFAFFTPKLGCGWNW